MCDPVTLAAAGASVAGSLINSNAAAGNQAAAINATNAANTATAAKEAGLQKQSSGIFDQTLAPYQGTVPGQTLATDQTDNTAKLNANGPTAAQLAGGATTVNAPQVVQDTENASIANRMKQLGTNNANLGALSGYASQNQDASRNLRSASDQIGTIGNFATEDANVGNALRQAAVTNSQKAPSPFGDILQGVGQIGAYGAGKGWFNTPSTPAPFNTQGNGYIY